MSQAALGHPVCSRVAEGSQGEFRAVYSLYDFAEWLKISGALVKPGECR